MSDPVVLGNKSLDKFDVLVVGSGSGGAPVASLLAKHGKKVLVLEAGSNRFEGIDDPSPDKPISRFSNDELKLFQRGVIKVDPLSEPRTFRAKESDGARTFVGSVNALPKTLGGGAVHASLQVPRFAPFEFRMRSELGDVPGANFADWPITYDMLEPFYTYVERAAGVQGKGGADPFAGPRSADYPMPPGPPMYMAELLAAGAKKQGLTLFPFPQAVNSRPYDGRPACVHCGFCGGYVCPSNAKGAPGVTMIRKALLSGNCQLWPDTRAARLLMSGDKKTVTGIEAILADGTRRTFTADRYVLAASPIEDVRLLLLSDPGGAGIGNSSGLVGRNLMFHYFTTALGVFEERLHGHRGRTTTHGFSDFRGAPKDYPNRPMGGVVTAAGIEDVIGEAETYARIFRAMGLDINPPLLKSALKQSPGRDHAMGLTMYGEDAPQLSNRVDLDPAVRDIDGLPVARVTYSPHVYETSAKEFYGPKLLDLFGASGARYAFIAPGDAVPTTHHIMGTMRMGTDPKQSVCDASGRFHDLGNLYVSDGALFPTGAGYNPTLTIWAVAAYVAGEMLFPGTPEKALV